MVCELISRSSWGAYRGGDSESDPAERTSAPHAEIVIGPHTAIKLSFYACTQRKLIIRPVPHLGVEEAYVPALAGYCNGEDIVKVGANEEPSRGAANADDEDAVFTAAPAVGNLDAAVIGDENGVHSWVSSDKFAVRDVPDEGLLTGAGENCVTG